MSLLSGLLIKAAEAGASDVHIKCNRKPCFRINSQLVDSGFPAMTAHEVQAVVNEIMPSHVVDAFRETHEADFSIEESGAGRFRVNVFMAQGMPALALRHVKTAIPTLEDLNLPEQLGRLTRFERGIIVLAGTTGSGKSSTLAALIGMINRTKRKRIITIEDPVEYLFEDDQSIITQREIGMDTLGYEDALKHVLRQDPDVILIGEMRDRLSVRTALLAAETGHLIFSTLHAATASVAIPRILDVFPRDERDQIRMALAGTQHAIVCQRLIPAVSGSVLPAVEIMINTPTITKLLENNQMDILPAAIETGREDGMISFNQSIYDLIKRGLISEKDGLRYATNAESLRMNLRGIFLDEGHRILGGTS